MDERDKEQLRQKLLGEIYAGASAGLGAMILDEQAVRQADEEELEQIARTYGI